MQDEDKLLDMSPGKRGIILFQLFLHLSASETPILVDQPEDNLDNRTVYKELNQFIKQQKTKSPNRKSSRFGLFHLRQKLT